jgi:hypothetical protein
LQSLQIQPGWISLQCHLFFVCFVFEPRAIFGVCGWVRGSTLKVATSSLVIPSYLLGFDGSVKVQLERMSGFQPLERAWANTSVLWVASCNGDLPLDPQLPAFSEAVVARLVATGAKAFWRKFEKRQRRRLDAEAEGAEFDAALSEFYCTYEEGVGQECACCGGPVYGLVCCNGWRDVAHCGCSGISFPIKAAHVDPSPSLPSRAKCNAKSRQAAVPAASQAMGPQVAAPAAVNRAIRSQGGFVRRRRRPPPAAREGEKGGCQTPPPTTRHPPDHKPLSKQQRARRPFCKEGARPRPGDWPRPRPGRLAR